MWQICILQLKGDQSERLDYNFVAFGVVNIIALNVVSLLHNC